MYLLVQRCADLAAAATTLIHPNQATRVVQIRCARKFLLSSALSVSKASVKVRLWETLRF